MVKITGKQFLRRFGKLKNTELGEAFRHLDAVINMHDMGFSWTEVAENLASDLGYDLNISPWDNEDLEYDELSRLVALLYQKNCNSKDCWLVDAAIEYITEHGDTIYDGLAYGGDEEQDSLLKDLNVILRFEEKKEAKPENIEALKTLIKRLEEAPGKQLKVIKGVMQDYMFHVDLNLFGGQTNSCRTVGYTVDSYMRELNPKYKDYQYAAGIDRGMSGGLMHRLEIESLFRCDKDSNVVTVDFKLHKSRHTSESCVSFGDFIADLSSITINITDDKEVIQKAICDELNKDIKKVFKFLEEHPEEDGVTGLGGTAKYYGQL